MHTDACQAPGLLSLHVQNLGIDLMTISSGKVYGPQGIAVLYVRHATPIMPILYGGSQERGLRPGTESVILAEGFAEALALAEHMRAEETVRLKKLRDYLIKSILKNIHGATLNGHLVQRLANNINVSLPNTSGEMLVLALDRAGFAVSTGAACTARETGQSHVLKALSADPDDGNLRITLGRSTTKKELDEFLEVLQKEMC